MNDGEGAQQKPISDTILEFGAPVLKALSNPSVAELKQALELVITIWNAHVMALPEWGYPDHLSQLVELAEDEHAPGLRSTLGLLGQRRAEESFVGDARAVSKWDLVADALGRLRFDCTAKLPPVSA